MAKGWTSALMLALCWLGACAGALAQSLPPPAPEPSPAPGPGASPSPVAPAPGPGGSPPPYSGPRFPPPWHGPANGWPNNPPPCPPPEPEPAPPPVEPDCDTTPCFHIGADYLLWFASKQNFPPLVTTGPFSAPIPAALGQPGTKVLLGGSDLEDNRASGARINFGIGLDRNSEWSIDGSLFMMEQSSGTETVIGNGAANSLAIGRPFYNVVAKTQDADPVALPKIASGSLHITTPRQLFGADIDLRNHLWADQGNRIVMLVGARYLQLDDELRIDETSQDLPALGARGNNYYLSEQTNTRNRFYGGQIGSEYELRVGPVFLCATGKVAAGLVEQTLSNSAITRITEPSGIVTTGYNSALYIAPNNAGHFYQTRFGVVPEGALKLGFDFNENVRLTFGYSFLYLSAAARPANQINQNVNIQPVGSPAGFTPAAPIPMIQSSGFWAQGINVGVRFSF